VSPLLDIAGRRIASVVVSYVSPYIILTLPAWTSADDDPRPDAVINVDGPVSLTIESGQVTVDPESGPNDAFLHLIGKTVATADASDDGSLLLTFQDGATLAIAPFQYEAWHFVADDGSQVASVAGGGLGIWHSQSGTAPAPASRSSGQQRRHRVPSRGVSDSDSATHLFCRRNALWFRSKEDQLGS
jgi:hypothetical protein